MGQGGRHESNRSAVFFISLKGGMPASCALASHVFPSPVLPSRFSGQRSARFLWYGWDSQLINHRSLRALGLAFRDVAIGFSGSTTIKETFNSQPLETQIHI